MSRCCPHEDEQHRSLATCQDVIHYPSEDYPCLCTGFEGEEKRCRKCEHARESHVVKRVCTECACTS